MGLDHIGYIISVFKLFEWYFGGVGWEKLPQLAPAFRPFGG